MDTSAKEIKRQAGRVEEQLTKFLNSAYNVRGELENIVEVVISEDSQLARTITNTATTLDALESKMQANFDKLAQIMHKYADETLGNEEVTTDETAAINNELEDILSALNAMDI